MAAKLQNKNITAKYFFSQCNVYNVFIIKCHAYQSRHNGENSDSCMLSGGVSTSAVS